MNISLHKKQALPFSAIFFVAAIFLTLPNLLTPLRLNTDVIRYLNIAEYLCGNTSGNGAAATDFYPHGYPWLLVGLHNAGVMLPITVVVINVACILVSCYFFLSLFSTRLNLVVAGLALISFINIKEFTLSLPDQLFSATFFSAIYCWQRVRGGNYVMPMLAIFLTVSACYLRTAGLAIIIGLVVYSIHLKYEWIMQKRYRVYASLALVVTAAVLFISGLPLLEKRIDYFRQLDLESVSRNPALIFSRLNLHFTELGEVFINIPYSKLSPLMTVRGLDLAMWFLPISGIVALCIFVKTIIYRKLYKFRGFYIFISYLVMIFLWPYYDARFLTPLVPIFLYCFIVYLFEIKKSLLPRLSWIIIFIGLGVSSALYSDGLSLSNIYFIKHYGADPTLTAEYRRHFLLQQQADKKRGAVSLQKDDRLFLLEKYDDRPALIIKLQPRLQMASSQ